MVNICILFVGGGVLLWCGVVSSPGLQRETHSGGPLLPTSYRPHGPPVLYLSHHHGPPIMWPLSPYGLPTTIPMAPPGKPTW